MSKSKLPLRIRVDIRDRFEALDSSPQKALSTLEGIVGLKPRCNIDWNLLYTTLEKNFPDKSTFVPIVADVVVAWCDVLCGRLEDARDTAWTENLVDMFTSAGAIRLRLQVHDIDRPTTTWFTEQSSFLLSLPKISPFLPVSASSGFESDFAHLFTSELSVATTESVVTKGKEDDWAELESNGEEARIKLETLAIAAEPERIPTVATIPAPDVLFRTLTPYILHVVPQGSNTLIVRATHGPSLQFLHDYLERWIKTDYQDSRKCPLLKTTLQESHFGLGVYHDTLKIEPYDTYQEKRGVGMNPTMILVLVEKVLGYTRLPNTEPGYWEFRREVAFK